MKKALPYIWKGLGLLVILVGGLFISGYITEMRMAKAMKDNPGTGGTPDKVAPEQATNGFAQKVRR